MTSTAWPVGRCAWKMRSSGEATLATKGAGHAAGNVAATNVPFGGAAGQSAIRSAAFHARELVSGVGGGASRVVLGGRARTADTDAATCCKSASRRATLTRAPAGAS